MMLTWDERVWHWKRGFLTLTDQRGEPLRVRAWKIVVYGNGFVETESGRIAVGETVSEIDKAFKVLSEMVEGEWE